MMRVQVHFFEGGYPRLWLALPTSMESDVNKTPTIDHTLGNLPGFRQEVQTTTHVGLVLPRNFLQIAFGVLRDDLRICDPLMINRGRGRAARDIYT